MTPVGLHLYLHGMSAEGIAAIGLPLTASTSCLVVVPLAGPARCT
jgi:hypothetical protein